MRSAAAHRWAPGKTAARRAPGEAETVHRGVAAAAVEMGAAVEVGAGAAAMLDRTRAQVPRAAAVEEGPKRRVEPQELWMATSAQGDPPLSRAAVTMEGVGPAETPELRVAAAGEVWTVVPWAAVPAVGVVMRAAEPLGRQAALSGVGRAAPGVQAAPSQGSCWRVVRLVPRPHSVVGRREPTQGNRTPEKARG